MQFSIVYSSKTGNTRQLAEALHQALPAQCCLYFGPPDPAALQAPLVYVGFWTDKGCCDRETDAFLQQLDGQKVFLFGTAGFGGEAAYFDRILQAVAARLAGRGQLVGAHLCQGRMPPAVRRRYEAMEEGPRRQQMLDNYDRGLSHPDRGDEEALCRAAKAVL